MRSAEGCLFVCSFSLPVPRFRLVFVFFFSLTVFTTWKIHLSLTSRTVFYLCGSITTKIHRSACFDINCVLKNHRSKNGTRKYTWHNSCLFKCFFIFSFVGNKYVSTETASKVKCWTFPHARSPPENFPFNLACSMRLNSVCVVKLFDVIRILSLMTNCLSLKPSWIDFKKITFMISRISPVEFSISSGIFSLEIFSDLLLNFAN